MNGWRLDRTTLHPTVETASEQVSDLSALFVLPDGALSPELGEKCVDLLVESTGFDGVVLEAVSNFLTEELTNGVSTALGEYATAINSTQEAENAVVNGDVEQHTQITTGMRQHSGDGGFGQQVK